MSLIARIVSLLIGYAFGLIQAAYYYSKMKGVDIRKVGSGNAGSTNVARALGNRHGLTVFIIDVTKCVVAILIARLLFAHDPAEARVIGMWAGAGCTLGHDFPVQMNYRGGKGIACMAGIVLTFSVPVWLATWAVFIVVHLMTSYVSLGSLAAALVFLVSIIVSALCRVFGMNGIQGLECCIITVLLVALAYWQHRTNIVRLLKGTETKKGSFVGKDK